MTGVDKPLLHICYAPADHEWVHGRMLPELGLDAGQYRTRADDGLGALQLQEISRAVDECRFTVLIASSAARWDKLAQFAAALAQHAGLEQQSPRLIIVARDFALGTEMERAQLSLGWRALVGLDCSDESHTAEAMKRLREVLALNEPVHEPPACPYPGLERFSVANRDRLFGRDADKNAILQRIRGRHTRVLVVGPSGSGKSSLIHAAVVPELAPGHHVIQVVPRGGDLVAALRVSVDALEVPGLGTALDEYLRAARGATDAQLEEARDRLRAASIRDARRRVIVLDPLEEIFVNHDKAARDTLFTLLSGLWVLPWCTVILCMRSDFCGALMGEWCWRELEHSQYAVEPLDETGLRAAVIEPARRVGVYIDPALVERLIRELDRDRSSSPLPLLQLALEELWERLHRGYLTLASYERIVNRDERGLAAVLAVHAEAVVQALTLPDDRAVAKRILLDLIQVGEGRPDTRRQRRFEDLRRTGDPPGRLERVLEKLIRGRLVTASAGDRVTTGGDGRQVDLAHDALITGWAELARWIGDHKRARLEHRQLEARARERDEGRNVMVSRKSEVWKKHTILFLSANPSGTDPRALDREARAIQAELERSGCRDQFEFETRWAAEPLDLLRELRKLKPTVVHYSGHGGQDGLFFQSADGRAQVVSTAAIAETFGAAGASVKLVVLNACYSDVQAEALLSHIDCVVGMGSSIDDDAARSFAIGFYGGLGERESVAAAYKQGRAAISLEGLGDNERPQLKVRQGLDANQVVLAADPR